jgi:hypothetical protein
MWGDSLVAIMRIVDVCLRRMSVAQTIARSKGQLCRVSGLVRRAQIALSISPNAGNGTWSRFKTKAKTDRQV